MRGTKINAIDRSQIKLFIQKRFCWRILRRSRTSPRKKTPPEKNTNAYLHNSDPSTRMIVVAHHLFSVYLFPTRSCHRLHVQFKTNISVSRFRRPISQIPKCTCSISHNALFRTEMFCYEWNIVGYGTGAFWDLRIRSVGVLVLWLSLVHPFRSQYLRNVSILVQTLLTSANIILVT